MSPNLWRPIWGISRLTTCLVTGVAGFIGSHLADQLIREGYHVVGIDCFTDYYPRWLKERNLENLQRHEQFALIQADLLDLDLAAFLRGELSMQTKPSAVVDYVFHLAAQPGVRASWARNFEAYTRNNVLATQRLLEAVKDMPLKKVVYASSSSVYGDAETLPTPEGVTPRPISPYGVTKLAGEHLCQIYWKSYGLPVICLRYFTIYGPRQRPDMAFHSFIRAMLERREIVVYGDGRQTRDFTYVEDAVGATLRAAEAPVLGEVFNIGGGSRVMVNEVIRLLEGITGQSAPVRHEAPQSGDARHTEADIRKAALAFGYQAKIRLAEGLERQVEWVRCISGLHPSLARERPTT